MQIHLCTHKEDIHWAQFRSCCVPDWLKDQLWIWLGNTGRVDNLFFATLPGI